MKQWFALGSLLLLNLPSLVHAADQNTMSTQKSTEKEACVREPSRFQVGGSYTWASIDPTGFRSFQGGLGGVQGIYEYRPLDRFYGGAQLTWRQGSTHNSSGRRSLLYIDAQERVGYTFGWYNKDAAFTLFSGFGYKYFGESFYSHGVPQLRFRYNEIYVPVGLLVDYLVTCWCSVGLNFSWLPQVYPTVKIVPLEGARWIITNQLANFSAELPVTFIFTKWARWSIMVKPFYERWKDGHSTAVTSDGIALGLPGNTYNFWGIDLNFGVSF